MALINCKECGKKVSDAANNCPYCGIVVAGISDQKAAGTPIVTTQETAKKFKLHIIFAYLLFFGGCIGTWNMSAAESANEDPLFIIFRIMFVIGFFLYIYTKIRIWWHHK